MNLAYIEDTIQKKKVGIICCDHTRGDISYYTNIKELRDCLDYLTNDNLEYLIDQEVEHAHLLTNNQVSVYKSEYISAINDNLPIYWQITEIESVNGKMEDIVLLKARNLEV